MSKPNPSLSIKFTQIHSRKTCFSCEYHEPCGFTWFLLFWGQRKVGASSCDQCFSVGQVYTAITAAAVMGTTSLLCTGASLGCKPDSPWAVSTVARLLVPQLTSSQLSQKFQYNAAPHLKQILFSIMALCVILFCQSTKQNEWWWEWDRKAVWVVECILTAKEWWAGWG